MIRVFVLYEEEPDPERYERHAELCRAVPGGTFRHGKVFGAPPGAEKRFGYYAEWEFPDRESFNSGVRSPEMAATVPDAAEMGVAFQVHFAEVE